MWVVLTGTPRCPLRNNFLSIKLILTNFIGFRANRANFLNFTCHHNTIFSNFINLYKFFIKWALQ